METVIRVVFVYVFVWGCFRVLGKRELTQMSPFELVTLLFVPQLFSRALTRQDYSMTNAVIGATTLFTLVFVTSCASYRSKRFARIMQARPRVLVQHSELVQANLDRERIAPEDIFAAMHKVGLERLEQVEWAILESDGKIALIPSHGSDQIPPPRSTLAAAPGGGSPLGSR
jgi:uncharacterized membrane protein YcaP (DUF421 family)